MDLHEAQKGGGAPIGSPHEINNLKQQLQDTKRKLEAAEKQVDEKTQAVILHFTIFIIPIQEYPHFIGTP